MDVNAVLGRVVERGCRRPPGQPALTPRRRTMIDGGEHVEKVVEQELARVGVVGRMAPT